MVWQNESITEHSRRRDHYGNNHRPSSPYNPLPTLRLWWGRFVRVQAKLVVIDPLMAIFGNKDTYKDTG
jgi:hypothetical protein